jgi:hypothetical protein
MNTRVTSTHPNYANLLGYWRFDEWSGQIVRDSKNNLSGILGSTADADTNDPAWVISTAPIGDKSIVETGTRNLSRTASVPVDIAWVNNPGPNALFAAIQIEQFPDVAAGLSSNYPSRYWELWVTNPDSFYQANVTFRFDSLKGIRDESNLKLYSRSAAGNTWSEVTDITVNNEGSNADGIGSITANNLTSFGQFIVVSKDFPPVSVPQIKSSRFSLSQNYPNPFNPSTTIHFSIAKSLYVTLKVYDILGRGIATLVDGKREEGEHTVVWDGKGLSSGIYYYRLQAGDYSEMKKLCLLK